MNTFSIKRKNSNDKKCEDESNNIQNKIYESNNFLNKLDFNVELLNKHFIKCIEGYLRSRYQLDISYSEKYVSEGLKEVLLKNINADKKYSKITNLKINIKNIDLISQNMESLNYVSDLLMNINVEISYEKENIYTNFVTTVFENFTQNIWFKNVDKGWFIQECKPKNIISFEDSIIYKKDV